MRGQRRGSSSLLNGLPGPTLFFSPVQSSPVKPSVGAATWGFRPPAAHTFTAEGPARERQTFRGGWRREGGRGGVLQAEDSPTGVVRMGGGESESSCCAVLVGVEVLQRGVGMGLGACGQQCERTPSPLHPCPCFPGRVGSGDGWEGRTRGGGRPYPTKSPFCFPCSCCISS